MFQNLVRNKNNYKLNLYDEGLLNFLLSKKEKKDKKFKTKLEYLKNYHEKIFNSNYNYNKSSQFYYNEIINRHFDKAKFEKINKKYLSRDEFEPIFIVGLPRSGSTLIESILTSSLENITTVGESHVINMSIIEQIGSTIFSKNFDKDQFNFKKNYEKLKKNIKKKYFKLDRNNNQKFVDKSLENFLILKSL